MRVLHVAPRYPPALGGAERLVEAACRELARRGHDVHVLTTKLLSEVPLRFDDALPDEEEQPRGVHVHRAPAKATGLPLWGYGYTIPDLVRRVDALAPDVVHVHGYGYHVGDTLAKARVRHAPWKLVLTSHGFIPGRGPLRLAKMAYNATRGAATARALDGAIALSPRDQATFERLGARRVVVIPNGVDYERFASGKLDEALLESHGLRQGRYFLSASRLERIKGQDLLLHAFAQAVKAHPEVKLVIASEGSAEQHYRDLADMLGLKDRVHFAGRVPDDVLIALMRGAMAFTHTPLDEGFPLVVLEAMAAGAPLLATRVGSIPFEVGDAALLVEPRPEAIAAGLERMLAEPALRDDLRKRGQARARDHGWEDHAARTEALYREVVAGPAT